MEYIRVEYKDRVKEILEFISKEELGKWVVENFDNIKDLKPEDMAMKIRINTNDGKEIVRPFTKDLGVLENIAKMIDDIKLEEERISTITIIEPRVGVFK